MNKKIIAAILIALAILILGVCAGGGFGIDDIIALFHGKNTPGNAVFFWIRLPRVSAAFIIGASLAVSGAIYQPLLKNPLADPYTLGVSGGASFGAAIAIIFRFPWPLVALSALAGSLLVIMVVFFLSRRFSSGENTVIIAGIGCSIILSSAVMLLFSLAESQQVHKALLWLMGDLSLARYENISSGGIAILLLIISSIFYLPQLNLLSYGREHAQITGVSRSDIRTLFLIASFTAAIPVALGGVIGFIGLIIPHIVRSIAGHDSRYSIPISALGGGSFLVLSDTAGRVLAYPYEIPCGVVTGFCGGIFLLLILFTRRHN